MRYEARSEVTGSVWRLVAKVGDTLAEGDTIMIFESMKMEIPLIAETGGKLAEILVTEGQSVTEGETVATIDE
jgi:acetyl-CoA carboxylase biotin carboxyl carrier protein